MALMMFESSYDSKTPGWCEVAVRDDARNLLAVITHPCAGAKWFLLPAAPAFAKKMKFRTKSAAIAAALNLKGVAQ